MLSSIKKDFANDKSEFSDGVGESYFVFFQVNFEHILWEIRVQEYFKSKFLQSKNCWQQWIEQFVLLYNINTREQIKVKNLRLKWIYASKFGNQLS